MKSLISLNRAGDTIVEVLLALAIISITLGSSYSLATKSQQASRFSQERSEAQKTAEGQLEKLKSLAPDSTKNIFDGSKSFCIDSSLNRKDLAAEPSADVNTDDFTKYPAECQNGRYNIAIKYTSTVTDQFNITVRWDRLGGGRDEVSMQYRAHYLSTASPIVPISVPIPPTPPTPPPSGTLACSATSATSIKLDYSYVSGTNVSVFRDNTKLQTALLSPSGYTDNGRTAATAYTYNLRNGINPTDTLLDTKTCTTPNPPPPPPPPPPAASGSISSCSQPDGAFGHVYVNYSYGNVGSVSLLRNGGYLTTLSSTPGTYTDTNSVGGGTVEMGVTYRYSLNNGSTELASCTITTATFTWDGNIDIGCTVGCSLLRRGLWQTMLFAIF